jgi:transcriptional regulator NrdR family protein
MISEQTTKVEKGLECRSCGCRHFRVIYTRAGSQGNLVRRRECRNCGRRFTTWEKRIGQ